MRKIAKMLVKYNLEPVMIIMGTLFFKMFGKNEIQENGAMLINYSNFALELAPMHLATKIKFVAKN